MATRKKRFYRTHNQHIEIKLKLTIQKEFCWQVLQMLGKNAILYRQKNKLQKPLHQLAISQMWNFKEAEI